MKIKTKVTVILTEDEENTLVKARDILSDICESITKEHHNCDYCPFADVCGSTTPANVVDGGLRQIAYDNEIYGEEET